MSPDTFAELEAVLRRPKLQRAVTRAGVNISNFLETVQAEVQFVDHYAQILVVTGNDGMSVSPRHGKPLLTHLTFTPKTYEIDFSGVLSNLVHVKWLEDLRLAMLERYLPLQDLITQETAPMITRTEIQYKSPIRLFETVTGSAWLTSLGRTSWELSAIFIIEAQDRLVAEATQHGLFINTKTNRPVRVPDVLTTLFQQAVDGESAETTPSPHSEEI